jgi:hypothetical protein
MALRYTGSSGGGTLKPAINTMLAIEEVNKGNAAAGIPVLEQALRNAGFTFPNHSNGKL